MLSIDSNLIPSGINATTHNDANAAAAAAAADVVTANFDAVVVVTAYGYADLYF